MPALHAQCKSTKLLNHRSKLNSPKLAEESHMMEDNNHSSGVSLFSFKTNSDFFRWRGSVCIPIQILTFHPLCNITILQNNDHSLFCNLW